MTQQNLQKVKKRQKIRDRQQTFGSYLESYEFILKTLQRNGISPAYAETILLNNEHVTDYLDDMSPPKSSGFMPIYGFGSDFWEDVIEKFVGNLPELR